MAAGPASRSACSWLLQVAAGANPAATSAINTALDSATPRTPPNMDDRIAL